VTKLVVAPPETYLLSIRLFASAALRTSGAAHPPRAIY
jgi:hypothetical protein